MNDRVEQPAVDIDFLHSLCLQEPCTDDVSGVGLQCHISFTYIWNFYKGFYMHLVLNRNGKKLNTFGIISRSE